MARMHLFAPAKGCVWNKLVGIVSGMYFFVKSFLVAAVLCAVSFAPVRAEIFYIEDPVNGFSLSFPDLWAKVNNQKADDKLTVVGPGQNDFATCRVRVREDRRHLIYPRKFASAIQKVEYSKDFWTDYLGEYDEVEVEVFKDEAGLGKGFASYAEVSYMTAEGPLVRKRGIMFAALYNDRAYIADCSSEKSVYAKWRPVFLSIVKSVDFDKTIAEFPTGYYRDFSKDPELLINGPNPLSPDRY